MLAVLVIICEVVRTKKAQKILVHPHNVDNHTLCRLFIVTCRNSKCKMSCIIFMATSCWHAGSFEEFLFMIIYRNVNKRGAHKYSLTERTFFVIQCTTLHYIFIHVSI